MGQQVPDWSRAGARRMYRGLVSALGVPLEDVLTEVSARLVIVHAGWDTITSYGYAAQLAARHGGSLFELPAAPHSWPIGDTQRFAALVDQLVGDPPSPER